MTVFDVILLVRVFLSRGILWSGGWISDVCSAGSIVGDVYVLD